MKRRWTWFTCQADQNDEAFSILACLETIASVSVLLFLITTYDWGAGLLIGAYVAPIFFLRSPESLKSTKEYFERAVSRQYRFQLYGIMLGVWLHSYDAPIWMWIVFIPIGALAIGHLYNAWQVQFSRSLFYFREGVSHLPRNYYKTLFVTDVTARPEMFPGSEAVDAIPHWKDSIFFFPQPRTPFTFILSAMLTLPLLGVTLLRFASKSSALIYLPLIYLSWPSRLQNDREEQLIWIKSQSAKSIELFRFLLSLSILASLFFSILDASQFLDIQRVISADNPFRVVVTLYYVTDLTNIKPWQFLSLVNATLSIVLYFLMDGCRKEANAGRQEFRWKVPVIITGQRMRTLLLILWTITTAYFTLEFYFAECNIGEPLARVLGYFWGETTCVGP